MLPPSWPISSSLDDEADKEVPALDADKEVPAAAAVAALRVVCLVDTEAL
jgi:hypothetical protein